MDVDKVLAGLSPDDRAALLQRLLNETEGDGELDARVRRLEALVGPPGPGPGWAGRHRRGPAYGEGPGYGGQHHCHCHCPHCGW